MVEFPENAVTSSEPSLCSPIPPTPSLKSGIVPGSPFLGWSRGRIFQPGASWSRDFCCEALGAEVFRRKTQNSFGEQGSFSGICGNNLPGKQVLGGASSAHLEVPNPTGFWWIFPGEIFPKYSFLPVLSPPSVPSWYRLGKS